MSLWQAWKQTSIGNKMLAFGTVIIAVSNLAYVIVASFQLSEIRSILLLPGATTTTGDSGAVKPITDDQFKAITTPGCGLYIFNRITYRDIFGHNHWRHSCSFWTGKKPQELADCSFYNDGDEDYPDGKEP